MKGEAADVYSNAIPPSSKKLDALPRVKRSSLPLMRWACLEEIKPHHLTVPYGYCGGGHRTDADHQWYVCADALAKPGVEAVERRHRSSTQQHQDAPPDDIEDWCISRR
ncbi:hypothetical protein ACNKHK_27300 [Shigella flexneri]